MKRIDARGKHCPIPVVLAKQAMADGADVFSISVDSVTSVENLKRLAANQGYTLAEAEQNGIFTLTFTKAGAAALDACALEADAPLPVRGQSYTVFVGRDIIGSGDRELGMNLMRMFFYTLASSDDLPASVLFMNAGVKLPAGDNQVAEHLKTLADKGVEVLVCGTCLNFYGIADQLKIGTVSNMYDIVGQMQSAAKVITL